MNKVHTSKFLSYVLRHDPGKIGIELDESGWTDVDALLVASAAHGEVITRADLDEVVRTSDKQRFALSDDGKRIRANQGHSVQVDLQLAPAEPPGSLFHGTVESALPGIRTQGLVKAARHHVHLSPDVETATKVGARRGRPVILEIDAAGMVATGHTFYRSENNVWLVEAVPPEFITFPQQHFAGLGTRATKMTIAKTTLEAIEAGGYSNAKGDRVEIAAAVDAAKAGTVMYELDLVERVTLLHRFETKTSVTGESTLVAMRRLSETAGHVCGMNFASAKHPGGGFLNGAQAQEESLARASALYPCLLTVPAYYDRHRGHSALYLDLVVFSPDVPFIRDDDGGWLDASFTASIVTAAAPNATALRQNNQFDADAITATLRRRADLTLAACAHHGVERLVLGAWGAGVFGNDPAIVAQIFGDLLRDRYAGVFAEIVFAVMGGPGRPNYDAFARAFA
jgi:putative RNA 2'-phosphotransferase